ncbi:hypothetical protein DR864_19300 [Runella rosea]|uniref:Outer membrane protein beta-barrel domain-containing protein n=1 Tax=Runella rosea TaxID=2259595 RepID=A0A344TM60_9BACT|nr:hypothetical protein [Runella rosea]AXE19731.1 hypothetical protein DR864_19300 [Runella rosea]
MRKTYLILAFGVLLTYSATAQSTANPDAPPPPVRQNEGPIKVLDAPPRKSEDPQRPPSALDKIRLGGSIGPLSFGTFTSIGISPIAGYQVTERLSLGGGLSYTYSSYKNPYTRVKTNSNNYGGRFFGMFNIFESINLNAEYESLNVEYPDFTSQIYRRTWLNSAMVGASYSTPIGGRFVRAFNLIVLYNLSYNNLVNPSDRTQNIYPTSSPLVIRAVLF